MHAHTVLYAHKLSTTRRALEKIQLLSRSWSGAGGGLSPSRPSLVLHSPWWRGLTALRANVSTHVSFSLIDVGSGFTAYVVFFSFLSLIVLVGLTFEAQALFALRI